MLFHSTEIGLLSQETVAPMQGLKLKRSSQAHQWIKLHKDRPSKETGKILFLTLHAYLSKSISCLLAKEFWEESFLKSHHMRRISMPPNRHRKNCLRRCKVRLKRSRKKSRRTWPSCMLIGAKLPLRSISLYRGKGSSWRSNSNIK